MVGIYDTMTCDGSHLGFPIGIKNRGPSNDHSWAVWFSEKKRFETFFPWGPMLNKSCRSRHFEFHIRTKNVQFVEDHLMNIHVQFGFNHICSF